MRKNLKFKAWILLLAFLIEMVSPNVGFALGSGPSQPEMASFTPAGTSEMVDPFTGDFSYNIPLMDVEGYPINISYSGDITMEQDASWVGLGWNLNLGAITRSVRGLPDDFQGDEIKSITNVKPMEIAKVGGGIGAEVFGLEDLGGITAGLDLSFVQNNYKGFGIILEPSLSASVESGGMALNMNKSLSLNTLDGASINSSIGVSVSATNDKGQGMSFGLSKGSGFNTRTGQQVLSFGTSAGYVAKGSKLKNNKRNTKNYNTPGAKRWNTTSGNGSGSVGASSTFLPIGLETYTPYPNLEMASVTRSFSGSVGGEVYGVHANTNIHGSKTFQAPAINLLKQGSGVSPLYKWGVWEKDKAYGYFNLEQATDEDLTDFNRGKSVQINKTVKNLPTSNLTYDVFSVSGHGVSGMFRPFRNDIGVVSDPKLGRTKNSDGDEVGVEVGLGPYFHGGGNFNTNNVFSEYGAWTGGAHSIYKFLPERLNSTYEKFYMKSAGDLAENDLEFYEQIGEKQAIAFKLNKMYTDPILVKKDGSEKGLFPNTSYHKPRKARSKHLALFTFEDIVGNGSIAYSLMPSYSGAFHKIEPDGSGLAVSNTLILNDVKKQHHIAKLEQTNQDGERFIYGLPVYNLKKVEKYFSTNEEKPNDDQLQSIPVNITSGYQASILASQYDYFNTGSGVSFGRVIPSPTEDIKTRLNGAGVDNFYSEKEIPAYAHSYLLTEKQTVDYRDVTGDGLTSDDVGSAWKFNYTKTSDDYGWRMPYSNANFMPGFLTDDLDNKAGYSYGKKEMWYTHSVESKNYVAEFIISPREDGIAAVIPHEVDDPNSSSPADKIDVNIEGGRPPEVLDKDRSYKLDKIVLYSKLDRITEGSAAVPIKTVHFEYDYNLCKGIENQVNRGDGKLTLRKIKISYGSNEQNLESPYEFRYSGESYVDNSVNPAVTIEVGGVNPNYNPLHIDRWGYYKHPRVNPKPDMTNEFFPYSFQEPLDPSPDHPDNWASAWCLREITTPSGGKITVDYESDEYAYVQNKAAMQMFPVVGATHQLTATVSEAGYDNELYNDNEYKNRLWIKKPHDLPDNLSNQELKERFFGNSTFLEEMYFRFKVDLRSKDEYVSGYVSAVNMGYSSTNSNHLYIDLLGHKNPIMEASWGFLRENLFHKVYDHPTVENNDVEALALGIRSNMADIRQMFTGVEDYLKRKEIAKVFSPKESFIRLNNPIGRKKGGGARVKSIRISDNWKKMQSGEDSREYGQEYEYTTTDAKGNTISSGVASYETMIGNDENPWRMPVPYVSQLKQNHIPAINGFQETPFGEELFPSAGIGYSKVTVKSIHYDQKTTSSTITEHKFYTAKDFPVTVEYTNLDGSQMYHDPGKPDKMAFPVVSNSNKSRYAASQGYSIVLNDMHGKQYSTETYTIQDHPVAAKAALGETIKKVVGGVKYNYQIEETANGRKLNNEVDVISSDGTIGKKLLGIEYDVSIDSRFSYNEVSTTSTKANLDIIPLPPPAPAPLTVPMAYFTRVKDIKELKTIVLTKVIQQYGLIESVTTYTDQYATTSYNKMYDGTTGQVLLTETKDEYQDPSNNANEFQFTIPAYLTSNLQRMGPSYKNDRYKAELIIEDRDPACSGNGVYQNDGNFLHGDEVIIDLVGNLNSGVGLLSQSAWVNTDFLGNNVTDPLVGNDCDKQLFFAFTLGGDTDFTDMSPPDNTTVISSHQFNILISNQVDNNIKIYMPNEKLRQFLNNVQIDQSFITPGGNLEVAFKKTMNLEFGLSSSGNKTIFSDLVIGDWHGFNNTNLYGINELFDISSPIDGNLVYHNRDNLSVFGFTEDDIIGNSNFMELLYNNNQNITDGTDIDSYFLIELNYTGGSVPEKVYFIYSYKLNERFTFLHPNINEQVTYTNPTIDRSSLVNPTQIANTCPLSFELIDRHGLPISGAAGSQIKVIRSGNQNMLTANEGVVVADENPIEIEDNKFKGIKSADEINITQISAQEYSDNYAVEEEYTPEPVNPINNKFLTDSDGKFRVVKTHRYNAERMQNTAQVETAKDGYFVKPPPLWTKEPGDCYFKISSTIQKDEGDWRTEEEIVSFNRDGTSTEAKNSLDIHSSVFTDFQGKVEAVVSNAKKSNVAVENFENYEYLRGSKARIAPFSMLEYNTSISVVNPISVNDYFLWGSKYYVPNLIDKHDEILVKGIAHTGNYSIFLRGEKNENYPGNFLHFKENKIQGLVATTLGNEPTQDQKMVAVGGWPSSPIDLHGTQLGFLNDNPLTDFQDAIANGGANGQNELTYHMEANTSRDFGFAPTSNSFFFSVWVKEILPSNSPYKGISPAVKILNSNNPNEQPIIYNIESNEIDGWYQITGEFIYDQTKPLDITLDGGLWGAFFDDLRIHPAESNVKTYVYDQKSGRLKAQLDENNYATFYEYDSEGVLYQTKKETADGVYTVSESRQGLRRR